MNILNALKQLRDDIKAWVTINLNALNAKIDEKTIPIDNKLSLTSTNPVQNKTITEAINNIPRFSGDYNDLTNAPNIVEDDSGDMIIADESGNVIFKADADGTHTTALTINGVNAATEAYVDEAVSNIDIPEVDFTGYATEEYVKDSINAIEFPETDLSDYYNKSEINIIIDSAKEEISESIVSESNEWKVVDENGNIIFSVDAEGAHTTSLSLNGESVTDIVDNRVAALVDSAPDTLNTLNELAEALGDDPNFATTVATEIGKKVDKVEGKDLSTNDFTDEYKNTLDNLSSMTFDETDPTVPDWAKEATKPTYTAAEVGLGNVNNTSDADKPVSTATQAAIDELKTELGEFIVSQNSEWKVVDDDGNIIAKVDADGFETTVVNAQTIVVNGIDLGSSMATTVDISTHNTSTSAHNDIRMLVSELTARLNALADSDDVTLDQISEIVAYIKSNKSLIDSVTTSKVNTADIIDDLTTNVTNKPLSAAQGVVLKILIHSLQSALDAKVPNTRTINGKPLSGDIVLSASDVGAVTQQYVDDTITAALTEVENGSY